MPRYIKWNKKIEKWKSGGFCFLLTLTVSLTFHLLSTPIAPNPSSSFRSCELRRRHSQHSLLCILVTATVEVYTFIHLLPLINPNIYAFFGLNNLIEYFWNLGFRFCNLIWVSVSILEWCFYESMFLSSFSGFLWFFYYCLFMEQTWRMGK